MKEYARPPEGASRSLRYRETGQLHLDFHRTTNATFTYLREKYGQAFVDEVLCRTAHDVYRAIREDLLKGDCRQLVEHCSIVSGAGSSQAASLPFIVGVQWWCMLDHQRRGWNTGLVNVADRPYKDFIEEAVKTNHDIYSVVLGEREPFAYDHPLFQETPDRRMQVVEIPRALPGMNPVRLLIPGEMGLVYRSSSTEGPFKLLEGPSGAIAHVPGRVVLSFEDDYLTPIKKYYQDWPRPENKAFEQDLYTEDTKRAERFK